MRALVIGGTGRVGAQVVAHLRENGVETVVAARRPPEGGIALDLREPEAVQAAARGFTHAFLATPLGPDEAKVGVAAVTALRRAHVGKVVHLGIMNVEAMREIPHFETKIPIRDLVLEDERSVVVSANFFFQNDLMMLPAILGAGVYPLPVGHTGVWSVDAGDIGRAAARALMLDDWNGQAVPLCGPERLTGPSMAETWSRALGREIRYAGDAIEPFIGAMRAAIPDFGEWEARDFETMMRVTQAHGCPATPDEIATAATIIGRPQRSYAEFVAEAVANQGDQG